MGPLVSAEQLDRVTRYVQSGLAEGARVVCGGKRRGDRGYFFEPTIITDVRADMTCQREEIFGPVLTVTPFDTLEEVVAAANNTRYGLAAAVWTHNFGRAHMVAAALNAGTVWINGYGPDDAAIPRGGYQESGWGREMGREGIVDYLQTKAVIAQV
jgi:acyl-CoA reductase-like NAD-dependent aldehyde dehydrogenase